MLYVKRGAPCRPLLIGGHQEEGRRAGTENVPYIVGLAKAVELAEQPSRTSRPGCARLRDRLERELLAPHSQRPGQRPAGPPRLPNTLNLSCHYVEGEGMLYQLSDCGICASSGSACTSGSLEPSHVLRAMSVPFTAVHGSIRFSFSRYNTDAEVDRISRGLSADRGQSPPAFPLLGPGEGLSSPRRRRFDSTRGSSGQPM